MKKKFEIPREKREELVALIRNYFREERDEEMGELAAGLLLDFIMDEIAPTFYNLGVYDAHLFMTDRVEDLLGIQKY